MHVSWVFSKKQNGKYNWSMWDAISYVYGQGNKYYNKEDYLSNHFLCCSHNFILLDGNGFKTSTMRLGADVIVFSRSQGIDGRRFVFAYMSLLTITWKIWSFAWLLNVRFIRPVDEIVDFCYCFFPLCSDALFLNYCKHEK